MRIFDGERVILEGSVIIQNGRIVSAGQKVKAPEGAEILDGKGQTLLPGLIDAHVQVWDPQNLKQSLVFGVTAVVDMFMNVKTLKDTKETQSSGKANDRAYLVSPGTLVTAPGGHGTQYGVPIPTITNPESAQEFMDARIAEGSDFIKIIYDDGSAYSMSRPTLDKATLRAVIEAAHKRGKLAVVHAATLQNCLDVIEAEGDALAHLFFNDASDPEFGRLAARKKVFVIPTLSVLESMSGTSDVSLLTEDPHLSAYLNPMDIQMITMYFPFQSSRAAYEAAEKALRKLKAEAVPILAGKEAPPPEYSESGWISDFEGEKITANFGAGWSVSTDEMMRGKSTSQYQLVKEGAQGSQGALLIKGDLVQGSQYQWAGALFSPGERMMMPANLSFKKSISFWAKGDGKTYVVMVFAQSLGFTPAFKTFVAGSDWKEYTFPFEKFGVDCSDIMGIFIGASTDLGEFSLFIDNVRLK